MALESLYVEIGSKIRKSTSLFGVSGVCWTILENPDEINSLGKVVLITASGLLGEQPLVK